MTGRQYIDEIKIRAPRHGVMVETNDQWLLTTVNMARRNAQRFSMKLSPEKYGQIVDLPLSDVVVDTLSQTPEPYMNTKAVTVYTAILPQDFIEATVAMLRYTMAVGQTDAGVTYRVEMRRVNKKELYSAQMHAWNGPTRWAPVYAIDRQLDRTVGMSYVLYVAGMNIDATDTLFDITNGVTAELWYVKAIDYLEFGDFDFDVIPELEEMVINYSLLLIFESIKAPEALESIRADIANTEATLRNNYEIQKQKEVVLLPSKEGM
jgi:hypothetical protein